MAQVAVVRYCRSLRYKVLMKPACADNAMVNGVAIGLFCVW
jgi:hypothetical protein